MYVIILADEIGEKLWPVTDAEIPKALLPIYSEYTQLEETIARYIFHADEDPNNIFITVLEGSKESLDKQKTLETFGIPESNIILIPEYKGSFWALNKACEHIASLGRMDEDCIITQSDHFFWPPEAIEFHLTNIFTTIDLKENDFIMVGTPPGGPSPAMNYILGDTNNAVPLGQTIQDEMLGPLNTLSMSLDNYSVMPDYDSALEYISSSWLWDLHIYYLKFKKLQDLVTGDISNWDQLSFKNFSGIIPEIKESLEAKVIMVPRIVWATLDNWVSVKHLLVDSHLGLADNEGIPDLHLVESQENLVFKPPGKTVALYGVSGLVIVDIGDKLLIGTPEALGEFF